MSQFTEGIDYYTDEKGLVVMTSTYHLKRGKCCGKACKHCPYNFENVPEQQRARLRIERPPVILMEKKTQ